MNRLLLHKTLLLLVSVVALWLPVRQAAAQERKIQNKPFIDERRFHYGFYIGLHDQGLSLRNNGYIDPATGQQWMAENDTQDFGLSVGILGEWKLNQYLALRTTPGIHFGSKHIKFVDLSGASASQTQDVRSCYIGLPVALKVAAPRFNNYRPYVLAGVQPLYDLTTKKHKNLLMKPFSANLEVGLGCDVYLPFFKLIPELKFSFGLANVLQKNRKDLTDEAQQIFTKSLDAAHTNMVTLTFYFE